MSRKTPLYQIHASNGAKIVDFAGWLLPVQYSGIVQEHKAVRTGAGIFDIGHMGLIRINSLDAIQKLTTNDASKLDAGQGQYSFLCNERGGVIDDLLVYRLPEDYLIVANAVNAQKVFEIFAKISDPKLQYQTDTALALQGPESAAVMQKLTGINLSPIKHRRIFKIDLAGAGCLISRSGYTGEDGFEIFLKNRDAEKVWLALLKEGAQPCGLGARDTLRIEAALPLYGHELDEDTTPFDAGYVKSINFEKGDFTGRSLLQKKQAAPSKKLIGFELLGRGIPRQGYRFFSCGKECGIVTSGTLSPTLNKPIGMGYVVGAGITPPLSIDIRGNLMPVNVVPTPFYKRPMP